MNYLLNVCVRLYELSPSPEDHVHGVVLLRVEVDVGDGELEAVVHGRVRGHVLRKLAPEINGHFYGIFCVCNNKKCSFKLRCVSGFAVKELKT